MPVQSVINHIYVDQRCIRWGIYVRWLERTHYTSRAHMPAPLTSWWSSLVRKDRINDGGARWTSMPAEDVCPVDREESSETWRAVGALIRGELRRALVECYVIGGTVEQKAAALGVSRMTYYRHLGAAWRELEPLLLDLAAGIELPKPSGDFAMPPAYDS